MSRVLRLSGRPLVVAHRGDSASAPENTLAAFARAIDASADMVECDAHLTRDGHIILLHDDTLDRTTDGQGPVVRFDLDELKKLDAGSWFSIDYSGEKLPTLAELISLVRGRLGLNIEIKSSKNEPGLAERVAAELKRTRFETSVVITSFDVEILGRLRRLNPDLLLGLISRRFKPEYVEGGWSMLSLHHRAVSPENLERIHSAGLALHVWTVNQKTRMQQMIETGVDGIITNRPARLRRTLVPSGSADLSGESR